MNFFSSENLLPSRSVGSSSSQTPTVVARPCAPQVGASPPSWSTADNRSETEHGASTGRCTSARGRPFSLVDLAWPLEAARTRRRVSRSESFGGRPTGFLDFLVLFVRTLVMVEIGLPTWSLIRRYVRPASRSSLMRLTSSCVSWLYGTIL